MNVKAGRKLFMCRRRDCESCGSHGVSEESCVTRLNECNRLFTLTPLHQRPKMTMLTSDIRLHIHRSGLILEVI